MCALASWSRSCSRTTQEACGLRMGCVPILNLTHVVTVVSGPLNSDTSFRQKMITAVSSGGSIDAPLQSATAVSHMYIESKKTKNKAKGAKPTSPRQHSCLTGHPLTPSSAATPIALSPCCTSPDDVKEAPLPPPPFPFSSCPTNGDAAAPALANCPSLPPPPSPSTCIALDPTPSLPFFSFVTGTRAGTARSRAKASRARRSRLQTARSRPLRSDMAVGPIPLGG